MTKFRKKFLSIIMTLILFCGFFLNTSLYALDVDKVIAEKQGYQLTTGHILAFFAFLQSLGDMSDDPTEEEINTATTVAKETFNKNPELFVKRMQQVLGAKASIENNKTPNTKTKNITSALQQEAKRLYPQYQLRFKSPDISTLLQVINGVRFSNSDSNTMISGDFTITTDIREDIHFCNNGKFYMVDFAETGGGGNSGSFLTGTDGGEISVNAQWSLAQLPNKALILILKMAQAQVTLVPILSDRVNIQVDNKVFRGVGKAGC